MLKHVQCHGAVLPKPVGHPTNITVSDKDRMVKTIFLMREMKMPMQKHVLKPIIWAMFAGG